MLTDYKDCSLIVDVGSAVGTFSSLFAKCAPNATILSFEPNPYSFKYQARQLHLNGLLARVKIYNAGLGDTRHMMTFNYDEGARGSMWGRFDDSLIKRNNADIEILKLDDVVSELQIKMIDLIKIDIEGYELPALRGMRCICERFRPVILCEMSLTFMVLSSANRYRETIDFINDIEYDIFLIKEGRLVPYQWPESRIMNFILLPRGAMNGLGGHLRRSLQSI